MARRLRGVRRVGKVLRVRQACSCRRERARLRLRVRHLTTGQRQSELCMKSGRRIRGRDFAFRRRRQRRIGPNLV